MMFPRVTTLSFLVYLILKWFDSLYSLWSSGLESLYGFDIILRIYSRSIPQLLPSEKPWSSSYSIDITREIPSRPKNYYKWHWLNATWWYNNDGAGLTGFKNFNIYIKIYQFLNILLMHNLKIMFILEQGLFLKKINVIFSTCPVKKCFQSPILYSIKF